MHSSRGNIYQFLVFLQMSYTPIRHAGNLRFAAELKYTHSGLNELSTPDKARPFRSHVLVPRSGSAETLTDCDHVTKQGVDDVLAFGVAEFG